MFNIKIQGQKVFQFLPHTLKANTIFENIFVKKEKNLKPQK